VSSNTDDEFDFRASTGRGPDGLERALETIRGSRKVGLPTKAQTDGERATRVELPEDLPPSLRKLSWMQRRAVGLCTLCCRVVEDHNPKYGRPYTLCETHRALAHVERKGKERLSPNAIAIAAVDALARQENLDPKVRADLAWERALLERREATLEKKRQHEKARRALSRAQMTEQTRANDTPVERKQQP
jgi:hypothetical protein